MKKGFLTKHIVMLYFLVAVPYGCLAQDDFALDLKIDLFRLTFNKIPFKDLTYSDVVDVLGEPTVPDFSYLADIVGPRIYYPYEGMMFWFNPKTKDPNQGLISMTLYLIDDWFTESPEFSFAYPGSIIPELTYVTVSEDVLSLFKKYKVTFLSAGDYRKQRAEQGYSSDTANFYYNYYTAEMKEGYVTFSCDEETDYVDCVTISF